MHATLSSRFATLKCLFRDASRMFVLVSCGPFRFGPLRFVSFFFSAWPLCDRIIRPYTMIVTVTFRTLALRYVHWVAFVSLPLRSLEKDDHAGEHAHRSALLGRSRV